MGWRRRHLRTYERLRGVAERRGPAHRRLRPRRLRMAASSRRQNSHGSPREMSYGEVQRIIGEPGVEQSRSSIAGITVVMYAWANDDGFEYECDVPKRSADL